MYNARPGLLIGFHGCDRSRQQELIQSSATIPRSEKPYDWLGHGMYFWESNYERAMQWAEDGDKRGNKIPNPAVVGAVIDLGYCCDLLDERYIKTVVAYNDLMRDQYEKLGKALPENLDSKNDGHSDKLMRFLDCATIQFMHNSVRQNAANQVRTNQHRSVKLFDSVRGVFQEGGQAYPGAGFAAKSHIQICIRNPNCIKGFFIRREEMDFFKDEVSRD